MRNFGMTTTLIALLFIIFVAKTATGSNMDIFNNDFQGKHKELFMDVDKLNEYTRTHKVTLESVEVKEIDLDGAEFHGATFNRVIWKDLILENAIFNNVQFDDCTFESVKINGGKFVDCIFKGCKFSYAKMNRATFRNGQFWDCIIKNSGMVKWQGDEVTFMGGQILDTPLAQGNITFTFKKIEIDGSRISMTEGAHPLTLEDCLLSEVSFNKSHFSDVTLRRVKQGEVGVKFNGVTANSTTFEDVQMLRGTGIGDANVSMVRIVGGEIYGPTFKNSNIAQTNVRNAYVTRFALGNMGVVHISDSILHRSGFFGLT